MTNQLELFIHTFRDTQKYQEGIFKSEEELRKEFIENGRTKIFTALSFGGGTQSSILLEQHYKNVVNGKPVTIDAIIFSDLGAEPLFIIEQVRYWMSKLEDAGDTTPFVIAKHEKMVRGGLEEAMLRYILEGSNRNLVPFHTMMVDENGEMHKGKGLNRICTTDMKIAPAQRAARKLAMEKFGYDTSAKILRTPNDVGIIFQIGYSADELRRVNRYASTSSIYLSYPLIEQGIDTQDSIDYLNAFGLPNKRSRCYMCPFNCGDVEKGVSWEEIIELEPLSFLKACYLEENTRNLIMNGETNVKALVYLDRRCEPLRTLYKADFEKIILQYSQEFEEWLEEWKVYIKENPYPYKVGKKLVSVPEAVLEYSL